MNEIMDQLIEDSKIKSLAQMLQDGISEERPAGTFRFLRKCEGK